MANFPSKEKLKKKLLKLEGVSGASMLSPNASASDRFKHDLCKNIVIYMHDHGLTQRELASELDVDEARTSELVNYKISKFSVDKLVEYNEMLYPKVKFAVG